MCSGVPRTAGGTGPASLPAGDEQPLTRLGDKRLLVLLNRGIEVRLAQLASCECLGERHEVGVGLGTLQAG